MDTAPQDQVYTYFSHPELMFPMIENGKVPTEQFLRACQGIADFVGFLGTAFIPIKNDISGNVTKVRTKYESGKDKCKYIEDLVEDDLARNNGKMGTATEGLLWLKRGLEFMLEFLSEMVQVIILAAPTRTTILKVLAKGEEGMDDICIDHIAAHLDNFRTDVAHIVNYYITKKLDTPNPLLTKDY
ncbi:Glycolipid transfer protein [Dirofilaria immitis]|nr:Glycolipid transfer protein [Dirofilaria immitis]